MNGTRYSNSQVNPNNLTASSYGWSVKRTVVLVLASALGILIGQWLIHQATVAYANRVPIVLNNRPALQVYVCPKERRDVYKAMAAGHVKQDAAVITQEPVDSALLQQMTTAGRVYTVPEGTHVRWMTSEGDCVEVQITDGPDKGREGWVYDQWVVPQ